MRVLVFISLFCAGHLASGQYKQQLHEREAIHIDGLETKPVKQKRWVKAVTVPATLIGLGVYSALDNDIINRYEIREERNEHLPYFQTKVDNYLLYAPIVAVYGLNIAGVKGKHDFRNRTLLLVKSEAIMLALTFTLKSVTHETRPDGSDQLSFPSGHTAQAFAAATFMAKEYGDESPWYTIGAYGMATAVGAMRILNNRHWVSDVLAGAGIGILSTNIAYLTHRYRWANKNSQLTVIPMYGSGPAVYLSYRLNK